MIPKCVIARSLAKMSCLAVTLLLSPVQAAELDGTFRQHDKLELRVALEDHSLLDSGQQPNPFTDYRMDVSFTAPDGETIDVPGFFAGDGAGNGLGNIWMVRYRPDQVGNWTYSVSFQGGQDAYLGGGSNTGPNGSSGSFYINATVDDAISLYPKGRLEYVGEHYLRWSRSKDYWIKGGTNSPENFLGYSGFPNTQKQGGRGKLLHFDKHNGIIGALDYLSAHRVNSIYFLPMNLGGDAQDTYPWVTPTTVRNFDIDKLYAWNQTLDYAAAKGIALNVVLAEQEEGNRNWLDDGAFGDERKLYLRELVARFAYLPAIKWNLAEENRFDIDTLVSMADYIRSLDWANHQISVHNFVAKREELYGSLFGVVNFDASSVQYVEEDIEKAVLEIRSGSAAAGWKWIVDMDENNEGKGDIGLESSDQDRLRKVVLYPVYFNGGQIEWFASGQDQSLDDFTQFEDMWRWMWFARRFMQEHIPYWQMDDYDTLLSSAEGEVFAKPGEVYAVYYPNASVTGSLTLASGRYLARWFNPRTGEFDGTSLPAENIFIPGEPPQQSSQDWVLLVQKSKSEPEVTAPHFSTAQRWSDSFAVGDQCYCDTGFDHGLGNIQIATPQGDKSLVEVCADIEATFGEPAISGRTYYNTVQCGHPPQNNAADEAICPGIPLGAGNYKGPGCKLTGPKWNLHSVYANENYDSDGAADQEPADDASEPVDDAEIPPLPEEPVNTVTDSDQADVNTTADSVSSEFVVVEIEDYKKKVAGKKRQWVSADKPDSSGGALITNPDKGVINTKTDGSAQLSYSVNFPKAGTYLVWLRGWGDTKNGEGKSDSAHIGLGPKNSQIVESFPAGWHWSNSKRGGGKVTVKVPSAGVHELNVWMREDGLALDKIIFTPDPAFVPTGTGQFSAETPDDPVSENVTDSTQSAQTPADSQSDSDDNDDSGSDPESLKSDNAPLPSAISVSIEVENFQTKSSTKARQWVNSNRPNASGSALISTPDKGLIKLKPSGSPKLTYTASLPSPGKYYVWIRGWGDTKNGRGKSDSVHVGLNAGSAQVLENFPSGWSWSNSKRGGGRVAIQVATAGTQWLNLWMREDGLALDKIILTQDAQFIPTGIEPLSDDIPTESNSEDTPPQETASADSESASDSSNTHDNEQQPESENDSQAAQLTLEIENFKSKYAGKKRKWVSVKKPNASGTGALTTTPDSGLLSGKASGSAKLSYLVNFPEPGKYFVWLRGWGDTKKGEGKSDSAHVGMTANSSQVLENFPAGWHWSNSKRGGGVVSIQVPTAGIHNINVWMREDGLALDKMILTKDPLFQPTGTSPGS